MGTSVTTKTRRLGQASLTTVAALGWLLLLSFSVLVLMGRV